MQGKFTIPFYVNRKPAPAALRRLSKTSYFPNLPGFSCRILLKRQVSDLLEQFPRSSHTRRGSCELNWLNYSNSTHCTVRRRINRASERASGQHTYRYIKVSRQKSTSKPVSRRLNFSFWDSLARCGARARLIETKA